MQLNEDTQICCYKESIGGTTLELRIIVSSPEFSQIFKVSDDDHQCVPYKYLNHQLELNPFRQQIADLKGIKLPKEERSFTLPGKMLGVYTDTKELEKNKYRSGYFARLTTEGIEVYNTEG